MSETRCKLVIVGDTYCGKVFSCAIFPNILGRSDCVPDHFVDGFPQRNILRGIPLFSTFLPRDLTIFIFSGIDLAQLREFLGGCRS